MPSDPQPAPIAVECVVIALMAGGFVTFARNGVAVAGRRRLAVALLGATLAAVALQVACGSPSNSGATTTASVSPASLTFSSQSTGTTAPPQGITLTNTGQSTLTVSSVAASGDFSESNTCAVPLLPGGSCAIAVSFTPTAGGSRTGAITITDNASTSPQRISLTGIGVTATGATPTGSVRGMITGASGTLVSSGTITLTVQ